MFFGNLSYMGNLPGSKSGVKINPGDTIGVSLGTSSRLAPGPRSAPVSMKLQPAETEVDGRAVPGSDCCQCPCSSSAPLWFCR